MTDVAIQTPESLASQIVKAPEVGTEITGSAPKPVPPVEEPKQELNSSRFAALAKKETALQRERQAIKLERDRIAKERSEATKLVEAQRVALTDPLKALELLGITYKQLTEVVLNDNKVTPELREKQLEEKLRAELKKELEDRDKLSSEESKKREEERVQKVVQQFKEQTGSFLKANKDKYPLINHPKNDFTYAIDTISAIIEQHYDKTSEKDENGDILKPGVLMAVPDAAKLFEDHLQETAKEFYSTLQPKSDGPDKKTEPSKSSVQEPRTITNEMSGIANNLPAKTEADRIKRALAALG